MSRLLSLTIPYKNRRWPSLPQCKDLFTPSECGGQSDKDQRTHKKKLQKKIFAFTFAWSEHILTLPYRSNMWRWIRTRVYRSGSFRPSPTRSSTPEKRQHQIPDPTTRATFQGRPGPRADLCEKLQGNIRLEGEYTCTWRVSAHVPGGWVHMCLEGEYTCTWRVSTHVGGPGLISVRNYRGTSGWRVSTHMGAQGWSLWKTTGQHQAGGWVHMNLEGECTYGGPKAAHRRVSA